MLKRIFKKLYNGFCLHVPPAGWIRHAFAPKDSVLVYLGVNHGISLDRIFLDYEECHCFEANPEIFRKLQKKYRHFKHVKLHNYAVSDKNGESTFFVTSQEGQCSSLSRFSRETSNAASRINIEKEITVPTINLHDFLVKQNVQHITYYISDIQGHDLLALKTMKPFIDEKRISRINCEVHIEGRPHGYIDTPYNDESGYVELLSNNYRLAGTGWECLKEDRFVDCPESTQYIDQLWIVK